MEKDEDERLKKIKNKKKKHLKKKAEIFEFALLLGPRLDKDKHGKDKDEG